MLNKFNRILTPFEKRGLIMLSFGAVILAVSETFSISIIIPIMAIFMSPEKISQSGILARLYQLSGLSNVNSFLVALIVIAMAAFSFKALCSIYILNTQQDFIGKIYIRLTGSVLRSYLERPYHFHLANNSSVLFKNLIVEVGQFTSGLLAPVITIGSEAIVLLAIFIFLACVYPAVTLFLVIFFGAIVFGTHAIFNKRVKSYSCQREKHSSQMHKTALEALHAVKEIKVFNAQPFFVDRFTHSAEAYTDAFVKFNLVATLPRYLFEYILMVSMLLAVLGSILMHKDSADLIPMLTVFGLASLRLVPSISKIYMNVNLFHYSLTSLDVTCGALDAGQAGYPEAPDKVKEPPSKAGPGSIDLDGVTFNYDGAAEPIFRNMSFSIPFDRITAVVGKTGSGKSTLVDIVMGLLAASKGALSYCGSTVGRDNIDEYRKRIGYVPQNIFLVDDTIASNIAFGVPKEKIDHKKIDWALEIAQLDSFVKNLPDGIDTQVGERGVRISGGQRQRIGIARAFYREPEILIFDEATSALDEATERAFYNAVKALEKKPTVIMITHRLSTLEHADMIHVMEGGSIVDRGSLGQLLIRSQYFKKMILEDSPERRGNFVPEGQEDA